MMIFITDILGDVSDAAFQDRARDDVWIAASDAGRRRLRATSARGEDIGIELQSPAWLADGMVLLDLGTHILTVARKAEPVMIVTLAQADVQEAVLIGHALGNRHAAIELRDGEIVMQVTETQELAARPLLAHGIDPSRIRFSEMPFATKAPPTGTALVNSHHHEHVSGWHRHES